MPAKAGLARRRSPAAPVTLKQTRKFHMGRPAPKPGCCRQRKCSGLARRARRSARRSRIPSAMVDAASRRLRSTSATTGWFIGGGRPVPDARPPPTRPSSLRPSFGNGRRKARLATASLWYRQKAQELSRLRGEEAFYRRLVGPSDRLEE